MSLQEQHDRDVAVSVGAEAVEAALGADLAHADDGFVVAPLGYWHQVWRRFKRDKVAIGGGITIVFLFLLSFVGAPIFAKLLGHGPDELFDGAVTSGALPLGPWSHFANQPYVGAVAPPGHPFQQVFFPLGSDGAQGRDEFLRLLYGGQASLEVAIGAMLVSIVIGIIMGSIAGYYGGFVDLIVSRITELVQAFPVVLFIIALAAVAGPQLSSITLGFLGKGVFTIIVALSVFSWFYPARIVRAQVLSLREKEFVEAARMVGASDARIIRSHLVPHLVAPMIVLATIVVGQNVLAEAGLSFLGVGVVDPTPSWGTLLAQAPAYYLEVPWLMLWPGLAVLITTLAFNLLGDGLRDAFDPRSAR
ncbi:MAG TPA: ABC transporter permease [Gaiellaceae bacterium]|jgi:ABC-type dipeptide/oligopeptide/nickel transport system permease subunit